MKHERSISNGKPAAAAVFRQVFCDIVEVAYTLVDAVGGSAPILTESAQKCYIIPTPNDEQGYPGDQK